VGVNTFRDPDADGMDLTDGTTLELARATEEEKQSQLDRLADFHRRNADQAPGPSSASDRSPWPATTSSPS
jgi:methylmalonyl-CoA mutase